MPYVFQETQAGERRPANEFPSLSTEVYEETFAQAFEENPIASLYRAKQLGDDYRSGGKRLDFESASRTLKSRGMEGDIKVSEAGITEDALNTLMSRKDIERRRQEVFGQAEGGIGQGAARLGIALGTGLIDPLNVATAFIPVVGEARYTSMLAKAGSTLGRTGVRAGVGAVEGVAGAALIEPIIAGSRRYEQADYGMADSLLNVSFGGLFGAGLHSVGGAVSDGVRYYQGAEPAWRGLEGVSPAEIPLVQNLRQEIAHGMDPRDIARVTETWSPEARRAVEVDTRAITPAEAAHQALPPQVRENVLKQAIIQAASDEPVNVSRVLAMAEDARPKSERWVAPDGRPMWDMTPAQLRDVADVLDSQDFAQLSAAFGDPETARRFMSSERTMSYDQADALVNSLSPENKRIVNAYEDGAGRGMSSEEIHRAANDLDALSNSASMDELARFLKKSLVDIGDATDPATMSSREFIAYVELQEGMRLAERNGWSTKELSNKTIALAASQFGDRQTAEFMLKRWMNRDSKGPPQTMAVGSDSADMQALPQLVEQAEKALARETDTGTPTADALKMATEEASLAQSDLKAVADRLGLEMEDAELRGVLEAAANSERWAKAAELATICLTRGG